MFQARPITSLDSYTDTEILHEADRSTRAEDEWRSRVNLNEVFPYAITPFTITYYVQSWTVVGAAMMKAYTNHCEHAPEVAFDVSMDSYHNFFSLRRSFMLPSVGGEQKIPEWMLKSFEMAFFGHEIGPQPGIVKASKNLPMPDNAIATRYFEFMTTRFRMTPIRIICSHYGVVKRYENITRDRTKLENYIGKGSDNERLRKLYDLLSELIKHHGLSLSNHFLAIMIGGKHNTILHGFLSQFIKDPKELYATVNKFLGISADVVSAEIPRRIERMADIIKARGKEETQKFVQLSVAEASEYMKKDPKRDELATLFDQFLDRFGHRCYNEWDLRTKPWRKDCTPIITMLQQNCASDKPKSERIAKMTNEQIIETLGLKLSFKNRFLLKHLIAPRSQTFVSAREYTKDISIRYVDVKRSVTEFMAEELHRMSRIPDVDLIHFIFYDELEPLIESPQPGIITQAIRRRQFHTRNFKQVWKFDEIMGGYDAVPIHLKPTKEIDASIANAPKLLGSPGSSGTTQGPVRIVNGYEDLNRVQSGDILVTYSTDIAFSTVFPLISGIVTEMGGLISHGAVVAREYGLPSLLGVEDATRILEDGEEIILDANKGEILRLSKNIAENTNTNQEQNQQQVGVE